MEEINKLRTIYKLKEIYRMNSVQERKESSAEHSWSVLILADFFLTKLNDISLNRLKIYELLMYHDLIEVEIGDVCITDEEGRKEREQEKQVGLQRLKGKLPVSIKEKYLSLFQEYESAETPEARFAKAIDGLDAQIHELDYKKDWQGWDEAKFRKYLTPKVKLFPPLEEFFEDLVVYVKENGYLDK